MPRKRIASLSRRFLSLTLLVTLLSACSGTQLVYNRADWFIRWAINDYVSLSAEQEGLRDAAIDDWLRWHRQRELPFYESLLQEHIQSLADGLSDEEYRQLETQMEVVWQRLITHTIAEGGPLLGRLTDKQVNEIDRTLAEKNREFYGKYVALPEEDFVEQRVERVTDLIKRWTGDIYPRQYKLVSEWASRAPDVYPIWYRQREQWRQDFIALLAERLSPDFMTGLQTLGESRATPVDEWEERRLAQGRAAADTLVLALDQSLSPQQRNHLLAELREIAEDVRQLRIESD